MGADVGSRQHMVAACAATGPSLTLTFPATLPRRAPFQNQRVLSLENSIHACVSVCFWGLASG